MRTSKSQRELARVMLQELSRQSGRRNSLSALPFELLEKGIRLVLRTLENSIENGVTATMSKLEKRWRKS